MKAADKYPFLLLGLLSGIGLTFAGNPDMKLVIYTVDGGGAVFSRGGDYELSGTIGQPDAGGPLTGGGFALAGGFWFGLPPGDCNSTGGVDLLDYAEFEPCLGGPNSGVNDGCGCFDVNRSGTVDLVDYGVAQAAFTGSP